MMGSLFSGIGGLELGLERAGFGPVAWQVECNPYARKVLAKHWPNVDRSVEDVRLGTAQSLSPVGLICGGFPCQDVSTAGKGAGLTGARSGLWYEYLRILSELRPACAVIENVASGARRWLPHVRRDLHLLGYRTRALALSAFDIGAPHMRRRVFVLAAHPDRIGLRLEQGRGERANGEGQAEPTDASSARATADANRVGGESRGRRIATEPAFASADRVRESRATADADSVRQPQQEGRVGYEWRRDSDGGGWTVEPPVCGVAHGVPRRVDRNRTLGNAVHPACAEVAGNVLREWVTP